MIKKLLAAVVVLLLVAGVGLSFWARSIFRSDLVRNALASQLSSALGQKVSVESVDASVYPRVTVKLQGVTIGEQRSITVNSLDVGTALGALFSRRIENASVRVADARIELPLPELKIGGSTGASPGESAGASPVQLVSIDEVVLSGVEIVSRGRTLKGDIVVVPHGTSALTIKKVALTADSARIDATGEISDLAGPVGTIDLKAGALDLDQLMAFASDFAEGSTAPSSSSGTSTTSTGPSTVDLTVTIAADKATMAGVTIDRVTGKAHLKGEAVSVDPLSFGLFGGSYKGALGANLGASPTFAWKAALADIDVAALTAFVGNPGVVTGRLAAQVDLSGTGIDAARAMKTARGTTRVTIANGTVKNLALVKSAVAATSLNPQAVIASSQGPHDEPFTEMGATLAVSGGSASTQDLHFVSKDIRLDAAGALKLDGSVVNLKGQVQLSEELSRQANANIVRFTQQDGRITLPAAITGVAGKYSIEIDANSMAKRAVVSEAKGRATEAVKKGLGGFLRR
jgi:uncharacterized protein involved in outer membrane biogenesis